MRRPLEVDIESAWRVNVRGPQSWELCKQAGRRRPAWSRATRSWVVSERTARDVVAMAEAAGMSVVITGTRTAAARRTETISPGESPDPGNGLW